MRAIVPGGYMLATGDASEGRYLIVQLCDGHAATPKVINLETGQEVDLKNPSKEAPQDGKGGHPVCVFAAAPGVALPALRQSQWSKPLNAMLTMRLSKPFALAGDRRPASALDRPSVEV
ncbi:MAG: hypothetical protein IPO30_07995 [Hyphomonadaceae bacterium]|nr:hypothetical protein [Hyphomonadaceae bacterium]